MVNLTLSQRHEVSSQARPKQRQKAKSWGQKGPIFKFLYVLKSWPKGPNLQVSICFKKYFHRFSILLGNGDMIRCPGWWMLIVGAKLTCQICFNLCQPRTLHDGLFFAFIHSQSLSSSSSSSLSLFLSFSYHRPCNSHCCVLNLV